MGKMKEIAILQDDWETALNEFVDAKYANHAKYKQMQQKYYAIYTDSAYKYDCIGPYDTEEEAENAMIEYDGECVVKGDLGQIYEFLRHNNKYYVTQ